jgi:hypothetical protein
MILIIVSCAWATPRNEAHRNIASKCFMPITSIDS